MSRTARPVGGRGQRGSVLYAVLAIVFFLSLAGLAIMKMTHTSGNVATGTKQTSASIRHVDAALERALNAVRSDETEPCPPTVFTGYDDPTDPEIGTIDVTCAAASGTPVAGERHLVLTATAGSDTVGRATVRILDRLDSGVPLRGQGVEVCDWIIGNGAPDACP